MDLPNKNISLVLEHYIHETLIVLWNLIVLWTNSIMEQYYGINKHGGGEPDKKGRIETIDYIFWGN